jgi:hypothetical protein
LLLFRSAVGIGKNLGNVSERSDMSYPQTVVSVSWHYKNQISALV